MIYTIENISFSKHDDFSKCAFLMSDLSNKCSINPKIRGVYILYNVDVFGFIEIIYVGKGGVKNRINNEHSKKNSKNHHWSKGLVIECKNDILCGILEKLLINILRPNNNKIIPKLHHLILSEMIVNDKSIVYNTTKECRM